MIFILHSNQAFYNQMTIIKQFFNYFNMVVSAKIALYNRMLNKYIHDFFHYRPNSF